MAISVELKVLHASGARNDRYYGIACATRPDKAEPILRTGARVRYIYYTRL